jgi:hypothetical protein
VEPTEPARRDRHLRVVRRLRIGVVSAGVIGSLGVAGAVAATAGQDDDSPAATEQGPTTAVSPPQEQREQDQPPLGAPDLEHGFGPAHASSGGS